MTNASPAKFLFVLAHPEAASFTASLARHGMRALQARGHAAELSDLYRMDFDPISDRRNFAQAANPAYFSQQVEERFAAENGGFSADLQREMDRIAACDVLVFQFPLWWLGMPAIMKGWIDRVFAVGRTYGGGRWFDRGMLRGKKAMLAVTVGGTADAYSDDGIYGPIADLLRPINHGVLAFCGFDVVEPFIAFAPGRKSHAERQRMLAAYARRLTTIDSAPLQPMLRSDDYEGFVLRRPATLVV